MYNVAACVHFLDVAIAVRTLLSYVCICRCNDHHCLYSSVYVL